jgi:hypothetical protein
VLAHHCVCIPGCFLLSPGLGPSVADCPEAVAYPFWEILERELQYGKYYGAWNEANPHFENGPHSRTEEENE